MVRNLAGQFSCDKTRRLPRPVPILCWNCPRLGAPRKPRCWVRESVPRRRPRVLDSRNVHSGRLPTPPRQDEAPPADAVALPDVGLVCERRRWRYDRGSSSTWNATRNQGSFIRERQHPQGDVVRDRGGVCGCLLGAIVGEPLYWLVPRQDNSATARSTSCSCSTLPAACRPRSTESGTASSEFRGS